MEFKKLKVWTKEEDEALKNFFTNIPLQYRGSKYELIRVLMNHKFNMEVTTKSVARRCNRLGLKNYTPKLKTKEVRCLDCKKVFSKAIKYINRGDDLRCPDCQVHKNRKWDIENRDRKLVYHKIYNKAYNKK